MTEYVKIDRQNPEADIIAWAAKLIHSGELVAFPTETVYGLGADALNPLAVEKIYRAKGRPSQNPLLIHVSSQYQVESLATDVNDTAQFLMDKFWPGPLSIILKSNSRVPDVVKGGLASAGFRMPSHPVALAFINAAGPLAAPSANLFGRPSPTSADEVRSDLDGKIAAVLDAGGTGSGVESTIIDLSQTEARLVRRGGISIEEIEQALGEKVLIGVNEDITHSPYKLYTKILLSDNQNDFDKKIAYYKDRDIKIGLVQYNETGIADLNPGCDKYLLDLSGQGTSLYSIFRDAEEKQLAILLFEPFDKNAAGLAASMIDRILRAASQE